MSVANAGRDTDALVAERLGFAVSGQGDDLSMARDGGETVPLPTFSTTWDGFGALLQIVGIWATPTLMIGGDEVSVEIECEEDTTSFTVASVAETGPLALCRAVLLATEGAAEEAS